MNIPQEDIKFIRKKLMPWVGLTKLRLATDDSKKKHPDIWITLDTIPRITVTEEWRKQGVHERRKRLVHEFCHVLGMKHGRIGKYNFSTYPDKDSFSKDVYMKLLGGKG